MKKILFFLFTLSIGVLIPNIAIADDIVGEDCVHWSSPTGGTLPLLAQELLNNGRTYTAPVSLCNSNNWTFSFSQAPAGNLSTFYSTSTNKATVIWRTPGVYIIKASINCGLWTDVFYKTVQVVNGNTGFSGVALSNLNDCPGQYTSFTLTNYSQNDNPIACYRVQITEVDNNNTPTGNYSWQNTNVYGNYNKVPINMSATANGFSLLPNKRYRVSLIVGVPYCVPGGEQTSSTYFQIGAGAFPITGSFSADSYGNTDGSTISTRIRSCSEKALNFLNTTNSSCGINAMELKIEQFSDISYTTPAPTPNNWGNTGGVYPSYNLRAMFPVLNSKGFYRLKATSYTNWGSQIKYFYIQTIDLADDDARFTFEVSTQIRNAAGYTSTTVNPFAAGVTLPVRLGPTSTNVSFTNFSNEYIDNFKVDIWQRDTRSALNPNLSIYTKNFCNPNPSNTSCPSTNSINFGNELMGLPGTTPLQGYFATGITLLVLPAVSSGYFQAVKILPL
jgi:hypothetical protein